MRPRHVGEVSHKPYDAGDTMHFIHEFTSLLMQIQALIVQFICMLSYFMYISIIVCNFML